MAAVARLWRVAGLSPPFAATAPAVHPDCRGRLCIGYQITGGQLQGKVEVACRTDATQVLTTIGWWGRIDDFSQRVLRDALRAAALPDDAARLPVFAVAARDLFRHTTKSLAPNPRGRVRRGRAAYPAHHGSADPFIAEASPLQGDLLAAMDALRNDDRLRSHVIVTDRAEADLFLPDALSALQGLYALFGIYLEQVLQPLEPHVTRDAIRAFIQDTRHELDDLAACHTVGDMYVERLNVTGPEAKASGLEVEGALGAVVRQCRILAPATVAPA